MSTAVKAFCIDPADNVATMLTDASVSDDVHLLGAANELVLHAIDGIALGHKIALRDISMNDPIIKFGVTIGTASEPIAAGQWVHLHNCRSNFDRRSQTLELHTGAATDTRYE